MPIITNNNYNIAQTPWDANRTLLKGVVKNALVEGPVQTTWNIKTGGQSKVQYKGTFQQVVAIAQNAQQDGFEYAITGGHIWTIEITFPLDVVVNSFDNEPNPITAWELNNTSIEQNILELRDRPIIGALSSETKKKIEANMKNPQSAEAPVNPSDTSQYVNAQITQNLKFAGVEGKLLFVPTLKRTIIVSNKFNPQSINWFSDTNGKVMTTETLVNKYGTAAANNNNPLSALPDFLAFVLPISLKTTAPIAINTSTDVGTKTYNQIGFVDASYLLADGVVTFVGWLEYPPEYQTISLNKIQISQQWVFNRWSAGDFGLYESFPYSPGPDPTNIFVTGGV